jgi:hypothetical protein
MSYPSSSTYPAVMEERSFISRVYAWMFFALVITAVISMWVASTPSLVQAIFGNSILFIVLVLAEIGMVMGLAFAINRISATAATFMFVVYSLLNGLTLSVIFVAFTTASLATTFFVTAGTFGVMSIYGYTTKRDLTSIGNLAFMALIGLIIGSVVNIFWHNPILYWAVTYIGILIFVGLVAYDTQKIKQMSAQQMNDPEAERKGAILGALALYLDFINLFLLLLRIFGRRR